MRGNLLATSKKYAEALTTVAFAFIGYRDSGSLLAMLGSSAFGSLFALLIHRDRQQDEQVVAGIGVARWRFGMFTPLPQRDQSHPATGILAPNAGALERQRLWSASAAAHPPYNDYQARTSRKIPVFIAEPV